MRPVIAGVACAAAVLAAAVSPSYGQQPPDTLTSPTLCRGKADPSRCGPKFVPEFFVYARPADPGLLEDRTHLGISLGIMGQSGGRAATGLSGFVMVGGGVTGGMELRATTWLSEYVSVDVGAGSMFGGDINRFEPRFPSWIADVALMHSEIVGVTARFQHVRYRGPAPFDWEPAVGGRQPGAGPDDELTFTDRSVMLGARFGRELGVAGVVVLVVGTVVAVATCCE